MAENNFRNWSYNPSYRSHKPKLHLDPGAHLARFVHSLPCRVARRFEVWHRSEAGVVARSEKSSAAGVSGGWVVRINPHHVFCHKFRPFKRWTTPVGVLTHHDCTYKMGWSSKWVAVSLDEVYIYLAILRKSDLFAMLKTTWLFETARFFVTNPTLGDKTNAKKASFSTAPFMPPNSGVVHSMSTEILFGGWFKKYGAKVSGLYVVYWIWIQWKYAWNRKLEL